MQSKKRQSSHDIVYKNDSGASSRKFKVTLKGIDIDEQPPIYNYYSIE